MTDRIDNNRGPEGGPNRGPVSPSTAAVGFNPARGNEVVDYSAVPPASLLRAAADNELDAEGAARLADHLDAFPNDRRRVAFEEGLRSACRAAMVDAEVPAGLADRLRARLGESSDQAPEPIADPRADSETRRFAEAVEARAAETRDPSLWSSGPMRAAGALAAVLVIAFSAVFAFRGLAQPGGGDAYTVRLARFVSDEHARVVGSERVAEAKFAIAVEDDGLDRAADILGTAPEMPECSKGSVAFGGIARCRVPGDGPSTHFRYFVRLGDTDADALSVPVSVFVKTTGDEFDLTPGVTYRVNTAACGVEDAAMYVVERDGLVYVIVAGGAAADGCTRVLDAMGVDRPSAEL